MNRNQCKIEEITVYGHSCAIDNALVHNHLE